MAWWDEIMGLFGLQEGGIGKGGPAGMPPGAETAPWYLKELDKLVFGEIKGTLESPYGIREPVLDIYKQDIRKEVGRAADIGREKLMTTAYTQDYADSGAVAATLGQISGREQEAIGDAFVDLIKFGDQRKLQVLQLASQKSDTLRRYLQDAYQWMKTFNVKRDLIERGVDKENAEAIANMIRTILGFFETGGAEAGAGLGEASGFVR